ncbi:MAG: hypothetical protein JW750_01420 [Anaerolineaceae bacterium]|nr:hypothetical protein [Anaerolineaceae bacterium]
MQQNPIYLNREPDSPPSRVFARPAASVYPPVTRHPMKPKSRKANASRRISVPLNKNGAEIQLPALPVIELSSRTLSLILVMITLLMLIFFSTKQFKIDQLEYSGIESALAADIQGVLNLDGKSIFSVNPNQVKTLMNNAFPELSDVRIQIGFPASVKISGRQRVPIMRWVVDQRVYLIDDQNLIYPTHAHDTAHDDLLAVQANVMPPVSRQARQNQNLLNEIIEYTRDPKEYLKDHPDQQVRKNTYTTDQETIEALQLILPYVPPEAQITYSDQHGFGWIDPGGWIVYFGIDLENIKMKILIYNAILNELDAQRVHPSMISVEYIHTPYYRP